MGLYFEANGKHLNNKTPPSPSEILKARSRFQGGAATQNNY